MALLTERALKRHKSAVITIEAERQNVMTGNESADFEWFNTPEAAAGWFQSWTAFTKEDAETYKVLDGDDPAMAYMTILIPDTSTMEPGTVLVHPDNDITNKWRDEVLSDISVLYEKPQDAPKKKAVVKVRRRQHAVGGSIKDADE